MSHVTKEVPWCTIDIDTAEGKIVLLERWQYTWVVLPPALRWMPGEMQNFHQRAERQIWAAWSNRAFLSVVGTSPFARRFSGRSVSVTVDIRRVLAKPHWNVSVRKVVGDVFIQSAVDWWQRRIRLDSNDFEPRIQCLGPPKVTCGSQVPVAHEFGHTIGNVGAFARGDEYRSSKSDHFLDVGSIMHFGMQLRKRHLDQLLMELNDMMPDTTFAVDRLQ